MSVIEVRLGREVDALRAPAHHMQCGHAMMFTTIAVVATSSHSFLATLLAVALLSLFRDHDIEPAEAP